MVHGSPGLDSGSPPSSVGHIYITKLLAFIKSAEGNKYEYGIAQNICHLMQSSLRGDGSERRYGGTWGSVSVGITLGLCNVRGI